MSFSNFIKYVRKSKNITQQELSDQLGVNRSAIRQYETGIIHMPSDRVLNALANYLQIDKYTVMNYILFDSSDYESMFNYEEQVKGNISYRYVCYLAINGWNFDQGPLLFKMNENGVRLLTAQMTKKREPDNKILISSIKNHLEGQAITKTQLKEIFGSTLGYLLCAEDTKYKGFHLIFNSLSKYDVQIFNYYKELVTDKLNYDYQFILFDPIKCEIKESISIKTHVRKQ